MAVSEAVITRRESKRFCENFSLIHRNLTGAKVVEFALLDNGAMHIGFRHDCRRYVALFNQRNDLEHVLEVLLDPLYNEFQLESLVETNIAKCVAGVLKESQRNDAGESVEDPPTRVTDRFPVVCQPSSEPPKINLPADADRPGRQYVVSTHPCTSKYAIWWLNEAQLRLVVKLGQYKTLPKYIRRQCESMLGRPKGRRLWNSFQQDFQSLSIPENDRQWDKIPQDCGGLVIYRSDVQELPRVAFGIGIVTDLNLNRFSIIVSWT